MQEIGNWMYGFFLFGSAFLGLLILGCSPSGPQSEEVAELASSESRSEPVPSSPLGKRLEPRPETDEQAERIRRADEALTANPDDIDLLVEAARLLETVPEGLSLSDGPTSYETSTIKPGSNLHYYQTLLMYRGLLEEDEILDREKLQGQWSTVAYAVAVWHLLEGRREKAVTLMREIVDEPYWARLGHVAAEADLIRIEAAQ